MRIGVVVEQFDNTNHCHVRTLPPQIFFCRSLDDLKQKLETEYGSMVSYHYRDIEDQKAVKIGWVFQKQWNGITLETWVSLVSTTTTRYTPI